MNAFISAMQANSSGLPLASQQASQPVLGWVTREEGNLFAEASQSGLDNILIQPKLQALADEVWARQITHRCSTKASGACSFATSQINKASKAKAMSLPRHAIQSLMGAYASILSAIV